MNTEKSTTNMVPTLKKIGLTDSQARGYLEFINRGQLTPVELAGATGENRTNGYMICERLESLGLISKVDAKRAIYTPESPVGLRRLLASQQKQLKTASDELGGLLPSLISTFRLTADKPGVLYLEGTASLSTLYDDIIHTGQTLHILPSEHDRDDPDVANMIDSQIARQRQAGIKTKVLLRKEVFDHFEVQTDELLEVRESILHALDAQIMIYGPNVAISTFTNGIITTIITNAVIAGTFMQIFNAHWNLSPLATTTDG